MHTHTAEISEFAQRFSWNTKKERAAQMVAGGQFTNKDIAAELKISLRTLANWKNTPSFQNRVEDRRAIWRNRILTTGIADRARRVEALDDRWNRMKRVIEERASDPSMKDIPGGTTGLIVREIKAVGTGKDMELVDEFSVDTALLREMRAHEEQAAKELGQWIEKKSVDIKDGTWSDLAREIAASGAQIEATITVNGHANGHGD